MGRPATGISVLAVGSLSTSGETYAANSSLSNGF